VTRDEAYQKVLAAVTTAREQAKFDDYMPTLRNVLAALEALGVLKFDEVESLDFGRVTVPKGETVVLLPAKQDECEFTEKGVAYRIRSVDAIKALLDLGYVVRKP
jgi:hypothetical protein